MAKKKTPDVLPAALAPLVQRELRLDLPKLGTNNPGLAWIGKAPEIEESADGDPLVILGGNMAGLWFVRGDDGSIHLVDDVERELGLEIFASVEAFAQELTRQNAGR